MSAPSPPTLLSSEGSSGTAITPRYKPWVWRGRDMTDSFSVHFITHERFFTGRDWKARVTEFIQASGKRGSIQYRTQWGMYDAERLTEVWELLQCMMQASEKGGVKVPLWINNTPFLAQILLRQMKKEHIHYPIGVWIGKRDYPYGPVIDILGSEVGIGFSPHKFQDAIDCLGQVHAIGLHTFTSAETKTEADVRFGEPGTRDIVKRAGKMPVILVGGNTPTVTLHWREVLKDQTHARICFASAGWFIDTPRITASVRIFVKGAAAIPDLQAQNAEWLAKIFKAGVKALRETHKVQPQLPQLVYGISGLRSSSASS